VGDNPRQQTSNGYHSLVVINSRLTGTKSFPREYLYACLALPLSMKAGELAIGMQVRYSRTGTTGKVTRLEELQGRQFAELDTTGLLYRVDQLNPAVALRKKGERKVGEDLDQVKSERDFLTTGFQDALTHTDQSCEGGG